MNRIILFSIIVVALSFSCCTKHYDIMENDSDLVSTKTLDTTPVIYNPNIRKWGIQMDDPYEYNNYLKRLRSYSREVIDDIVPTHYILEIMPKTPDEQSLLETDEDIKISYVPFNTRLVSDTLSIVYDNKYGHNRFIQDNTPKYQYKIQIETLDGSIEEIVQDMPILYVVWPTTKPLPDNLDYSIQYMTLLPDYYKGHPLYSTIKEVEKELVNESLSKTTTTKSEASGSRVFSGYIVNPDNLIDSSLAMVNLRVRFQMGSNIVDTYTNNSGWYSAYAPIGSTMSYVFEHTRWKITEDNSTVPNTVVIGQATNSFINNEVLPISSIECPIHRALSYYFLSNNHPIEVPASSYMLQIKLTRSYEEWGGVFIVPLFSAPYIRISDNRGYNSGSMFANVCHELGHYTHYFYKDNRLAYTSMHSLFKESFANYVSWIISYDYYNHIGATDPGNWSFYFCQNYQYWTKYYTGETAYYSPFFVDLVDDFNQAIEIITPGDYNYDSISNIPLSIIKSLATDNRTWAQIKSQLSGYIGIYFSLNDYNSFITPYDYYFNNN